MRLLIVFLLCQIPLISYAAEVNKGRASGIELTMLPQLCQARFKSNVGGKEFAKWKPILGDDFLHVHHYCDGLTFLNRAGKYDRYRNFYLGEAQNNFMYTIKHLLNPNYILLPEIYYQLGVVKKKKGEIGEAIAYANKSIKAKKEYIKPYILLADIYIKADNMSLAEEHLLEAKKYNPKSRAIKRRLKKVKQE